MPNLSQDKIFLEFSAFPLFTFVFFFGEQQHLESFLSLFSISMCIVFFCGKKKQTGHGKWGLVGKLEDEDAAIHLWPLGGGKRDEGRYG